MTNHFLKTIICTPFLFSVFGGFVQLKEKSELSHVNQLARLSAPHDAGLADSLVVGLNTITDLQAYTGIAKTVKVTDNRRGGTFYHSATGIPDSGVVFVRAAGGYWKRQLNGDKIYPEWWDAGKADTLIDSRALTHVLELAVDSGKMAWLAGNYSLADYSFEFNRKNTNKLIRVDGGGTISDLLSSGISFINLNAQTGASVIINNLTFNGMGTLITFGNSSSDVQLLEVKNIRFNNGTSNFIRWTQSASAKGLIYGTISNNYVTGPTYGVFLRPYKINYLSIDNNYFANTKLAGIRVGFDNATYQDSTQNVFITNNTIRDMYNPNTGSTNIEANGIAFFGRNGVITNNIIRNIKNATNSDCEGIYLKAYNVLVQGNRLINAGDSTAAIMVKGTIKNSTIGTDNAHSYNIEIANNDISWTNEWITANGLRTTSHTRGIGINSEGVYVHDNTIRNAYEAIGVQGDARSSGAKLLYGFRFNNNLIDSCWGVGNIFLRGRILSIEMNNNRFTRWYNPNSLTATNAVNVNTDVIEFDFVAKNNDFRKIGWGLTGNNAKLFQFTPTSGATLKRVVIDDNTADSVGLFVNMGGPATYSYLETLNNTVNTFSSVGSVLVNISGSATVTAHNNNTGPLSAQIQIGNTTKKWRLATISGDATLSNTGVLTQNVVKSGTTTINGNGSTNSFTINHSLGATPTRVELTATSLSAATALQVGWWISASNSTTFTVNFVTPPVSGAHTVSFTAFK